MSRKSGALQPQIKRWLASLATYSHTTMRSCRFIHLVALLVCAALSGGAAGQTRAEPAAAPDNTTSLNAALAGVRALALGQPQPAGGNGTPAPRVEVSTGQLDPRLHLAPCQKIEPYVPAGQRLWGSTRVGLRCTSGPVRWNVYLPVTVQVWAPAVVAAADLPAGTELQAAHLRIAEADIAAEPAATWNSVAPLLGRRLARPMPAGAALRSNDVQARIWFAAGETVNVTARGEGFAVSSQAQALGAGLEGQSVRVRTDSGRILLARPTGQRQVEIGL
ncbi:MAG: hypothetical protein RLY71_1524 [Pseudomonadota bacterium]